MSQQFGLQILRAKIRGFHVAGLSLQHRISRSQGERRMQLRLKKRRLGHSAREHLIAYGFLRGIPYEKIERCAWENKPVARNIFELAKLHALWPERCPTLESVEQWLTSSTSARPSQQPQESAA